MAAPQDPACSLCNGTGWKPDDSANGVRRVVRCECWRENVGKRHLADANIPKRYRHCTLANFTAYNESLEKALVSARALADNFSTGKRGLFLEGQPGVGKTHLAVAILVQVIQQSGGRGLFYDTRDLLRVIRSTYDPSIRTTELEILRPVMKADLLVLDDLGAEKTSEWVEETMNLIVNTRYNERRATIFTSNYADIPDDTDPNSLLFRIGFRMRSRLHEMCEFIVMDGADYREMPANGGVDDLQALWKMRRKTLPSRAGRTARAQLREPAVRDGRADLKWPEAAPDRRIVRLLGLYIHVPFCSAICNYCNFNRGLFDSDLKDRYVKALLKEIESSTKQIDVGVKIRSVSDGDERGWGPASLRKDNQADTIFFGGGTPSLLEPEEIARIIRACDENFELADDREVTLEANPETVTEARLAAYRDAGVNRLSFGVQSFNDAELTRLSRLHGAERARAAVGEARRAGFDNVSLDLMMWLPGQAVSEWLESVDQAIALTPEHLSLYLLEVYPNAPLKDEMARAKWSQAPDEDAASMYTAAMERLELAGLRQYEISNVARPGRESRHNIKYWSDGEWLGFGCGAHSTRDGVRWKNESATEGYIARVETGQPLVCETHRLSSAERLGDALFMGLRLTAGVDLDAINKRYEVDVWREYGPALQRFVDAGCLLRDGSTLRLTRQGMLVANEVMSVFV